MHSFSWFLRVAPGFQKDSLRLYRELFQNAVCETQRELMSSSCAFLFGIQRVLESEHRLGHPLLQVPTIKDFLRTIS